MIASSEVEETMLSCLDKGQTSVDKLNNFVTDRLISQMKKKVKFYTKDKGMMKLCIYSL